eukprot:364669-Chlamydomonas_euryale.AAC.1
MEESCERGVKSPPRHLHLSVNVTMGQVEKCLGDSSTWVCLTLKNMDMSHSSTWISHTLTHMRQRMHAGMQGMGQDKC